MKYNPDNPVSRKIFAAELMGHLSDNGFARCKRLEGKYERHSEVVYAKPVSGRLILAVYTSCNQRSGAWEARSNGKDAIRIAGLYVLKDGSTRGIVKTKRVNRTGDVNEILKRVSKRIVGSSRLLVNVGRCGNCGAPNFVTKKGNECCAEICWKRK